MPGSSRSSSSVCGKRPAKRSATMRGALVQIAGAAVVAEPRPLREHVVELGRGQRLHRRPAREEALVEGDDRGDRGLLQHDLGQPHRVGVRHAPAGARQGRSRRSRSYQSSSGAGRVLARPGGIAVAFLPHSHGLSWASRRARSSPVRIILAHGRRRASRRIPAEAQLARAIHYDLDAAPPPSPPAAPRPREAVGFARKRPGPLYGVKAVGSFLPGLTRKAFEKYGFSAASLVTDWADHRRPRACRLHGAGAPEMAARRRALRRGRRRGRQGPPGRHAGAAGRRRRAASTSSTTPARSSSASTPISATRRLPSCASCRRPSASRTGPRGPRPRQRAPADAEVAHIADPGLRDALARLGAEVKAGR